MSQSSFKLLINWAIIMTCLWGWRGRNNLQVGEMRHEWLPSLTCAMLLVCVRSRQIHSVPSPFASVMGGWEHQLPPCFLLFCMWPIPYHQAAVSWKYKEPMWPISLTKQAWKLGHLFQLPSATQWTGHGQRAISTAREKGGQEKKLLGQLHILPCLPPPDLVHSWIMVCRPLHTSHSSSGYIFAALSRVAQEYLTWLWNTSSPLRSNMASLRHPLFPVWPPVSGVSRLVYRKHCESSGICRINEHKVNSHCLKSMGWAG